MHLIRLLLLCLLVACSPARREAGRHADVVRHIAFSGNGGPLSGHNDLQLRQQLETGDSRFGVVLFPFMYWVDPEVLDTEVLRRDAYRLETWYAHHGWFDAQVIGWEVHRVRMKGRRRAGVVDIIGVVEPGEPSAIVDIALEGLDKRRHDTLKRAWRDDAILRPGDAFDLSYAEADRALLEDLLFGVGFPYARVDLEVLADPAAHEVRLVLRADTGIHARFGPVRITGNDKVTAEQIRARLTWEKGKEYQVDELRKTEQELLDMGVFASVRITPDVSDPTAKDTPIDVRVSESRWRTLRIGLGTGLQRTGGDVTDEVTGITEFVFDGLSWSPRVSGVFRHANLFRSLIALELRTSGGVYYEPAAEKPTEPQTANCLATLFPAIDGDPSACPHQLEPTWSVGASASWPRILGERWGLEGSVDLKRDVFVGAFPFRGVDTQLAAVYRPSRYLQLRVGPSLSQARYLFDSPEQRRALLRVYGDSFTSPYVRVALDQRLVIDRRTLKRRTKIVRGFTYAAVGLRETLPTHETAQRFIGVDSDTRYLLPVPIGAYGGFDAAFALRGALMVPYADQPVGYPERAFLGGANTVRGFRTNQLGPYDTIRNEDGTVTYLPRGGTAMLQGSTELRYPWLFGITWATFFDIGALSETPMEFGPSRVRYSGGAGLRYETPVGPIRFDLSFRPLYPEDDGPLRVLNDDPAFEPASPRNYDFFSGISKTDESHPPFAMVFFLAIGEAL